MKKICVKPIGICGRKWKEPQQIFTIWSNWFRLKCISMKCEIWKVPLKAPPGRYNTSRKCAITLTLAGSTLKKTERVNLNKYILAYQPFRMRTALRFLYMTGERPYPVCFTIMNPAGYSIRLLQEPLKANCI